MFKKFFASFLIFIVLFSSLSFLFQPEVRAQTWYNQDYGSWYSKVYSTSNPNEIFGERYTAAQVQWIIYSLASFIMNTVTLGKGECIFQQNEVEQINCLGNLFVSPPAISSSEEKQTLFAAIFEKRPISAITYFDDLAQNLKIIPEAKAQTGFGFAGLNVVLDLWKISRNVSYGLLVVIVIAMSFMIMFRLKLNPQTVISVQSALPKIIGAIILITFSYAIAGLLIDLMYVVIGLAGLVLSAFFKNGDPVASFHLLTKGHPWGSPGQIGADVNFGVFGLFMIYVFSWSIGFLLAIMKTIGIVGAGVGMLGFLAATIASGGTFVVLALLLVVVFLVVAVIIIFVMFTKTVFALLKAYAGILLLTISAPFQILLGAIIPGMGFTSWMRSFVSHLATFVTVGVLFQLSFLFLNIGFGLLFEPQSDGRAPMAQIFFGSNPIIHPQLDTERAWPPLLGGGSSSAGLLMFGVSFVIFTIIPKSAKLVESFMKGQAFNYESAIGDAINNPLVGGYLGSRSSAQQSDYAKQLDLLNKGLISSIDSKYDRQRSLWSFIRGASGGRVK